VKGRELMRYEIKTWDSFFLAMCILTKAAQLEQPFVGKLF
jgi:hypothetical protein